MKTNNFTSPELSKKLEQLGVVSQFDQFVWYTNAGQCSVAYNIGITEMISRVKEL